MLKLPFISHEKILKVGILEIKIGDTSNKKPGHNKLYYVSMKKSFVSLFFLLPVFMWTANAQLRHDMSSNYPSYRGLVMCGYQGWFRAPGDGSGNEWGHYGRDGKFDKDHNTVDFWPDVSG